MTVAPGEDDGSSQHDDERAGTSPGPPLAGSPHHDDERPRTSPDGSPLAGGGQGNWRSDPSDADVDAAFAAIVSGFLEEGIQRHPSTGGPAVESGAERSRRRELRRLERAEEVAAFAAHQAEVEAERAADEAHFTPPEPPPLPRPKGRTIGAVLMILGGILLLARPGLLAVGADVALVMAVILIVGGAAMLLSGIWRRRGGGNGDGWDDGAVV